MTEQAPQQDQHPTQPLSFTAPTPPAFTPPQAPPAAAPPADDGEDDGEDATENDGAPEQHPTSPGLGVTRKFDHPQAAQADEDDDQ